ncbi:alginate biosynthesis sensor protein KinB [Oxobacter pfennigii]|uniref:histidine kinase n=1 Tax=Oxobacter pfennigii TaxID=36849 RepID=A0A0N8NTT4_9CLOT|nr:ATP-binding protein [Oxobacter pfennigii]KPU45720.1 alginate biosynthesis sensor protein KinB [Oxobacter pfennigii]
MLNSLKSKILSIYLFLILLISFIAGISIYNLFSLNKAIDGLIASNYKSIAAATNMIDAIERQDSNQLIYLEVDKQKGIRSFSENQSEFFLWLGKAEENITEKDEKELLNSISSNYIKYIENFSTLQEIKNTEGGLSAIAFYNNEIYPIFHSVKDDCRRLLSLNENSMLVRKDRATLNSGNMIYITVLVSVITILMGLFVSVYFTGKTIKPIDMLISGIKSIKEGNLDQEININTRDEVGVLAMEFNNMTKRLREYDKSSVNNLIAEKNKSLAIVKSISDPIVVISNDFKVILVNKSAENVFDIVEEEVSGGHFLEAINHKEVFQKIKETSENRIRIDDSRTITIIKGNKRYYFIPSVTSILNDDNEVIGMVCVFTDITHLKEVEDLKSEFISTVSHELRTPLTSIIMGTKLLLDDELLNTEQKEIINAMDEDGNQLMMLINDLLDLSKAESGKMQITLEKTSVYDMAELCIKSLYDNARSKDIEIINYVSPNLPYAYIDYNKIKSVLMNLLTNSLKFTNRGGKVEISASIEGSFIRVSVKDTGIGIPEEFHDKIFDKFSQIDNFKNHGTGLGLAIAKEFIMKHNGNIWVESKIGQGSNFMFTLPVYEG